MSWLSDAFGRGTKGMDLGSLDPTKSSMFTGAGTPWGEGPRDAYKPNYKAFNPDEYKGIDTTGLGHAMRQDIGQATARSKGRLSGALQRGGGGGADLISGMAGLEAQQGQDENTMTAKLSMEDLENRWRQYNADMGMEDKKYMMDKARYDNDVESRNAPLDFLGNIVGTAVGGITGGAGSALGGKLAGDWLGKSDKKKK